jgi:hypothetical protein
MRHSKVVQVREWLAPWQKENGKKEEERVGEDWLLGLRRSDEH